MSLRSQHHITHHHLLGMFACAAVGAVLFAILGFMFGWIHLPPPVSGEVLPLEGASL